MTRTLETARGEFVLRAEHQNDRTFLFDLFRSHARDTLAAAPLDAAMRDALIRMQFDSQTASYRSQYPNARFEIIERDGAPVGHVVVDEQGDAACIVDIALTPDSRGIGFGPAVLGALLREMAERVAVVHCSVLWNNAASLRMFLRLGFVQAGDDPAYLALEWRPGRTATRPASASCLSRTP